MASASTALKIFWTIVLILVVGGVGLLVANWVKRVVRVRADKKHSFKLVNKGNIPSLYHLSVRSTQPELTFACFYNNIPLVPVFEEVAEELVTEVVQETTQQAAKAKKKDKSGAVKPDDALKAGKSVAAKSGVAASLLGTLGSLLPGKLGAGLKEKADLARNVQMKTAKVTQAPQAVTNKMDAVKSTSGRLGVKSSEKDNKSQGNETGTIAAAASLPSNQVVISVKDAQVDGSHAMKQRDTGLVQTRELGSGEAIMLTLKIGSTKKRYPVGSFNYFIRSQQVPVDGRFDNPAPFSKTGTVYFKPISNFRYLIPIIGSSLVLLLSLFGIYYWLTYLWG